MHFDDSRWPLWSFTSRGVTPEVELEAHRARLRGVLGRQQRFGLLADLRDVERLAPKERQKQAQWIKDNAAALKQYCVGMAFVMDKAIIRGVLTAILWVQPMPMPHRVCATESEAEEWLTEKLAAEGLRVPGRKAIG